MDDDDQSAAEQHQMELEQRQREEEMIRRGRELLAQSRKEAKRFEAEMAEGNKRIEANWREFHGNHG